jgi:hypothetical protein
MADIIPFLIQGVGQVGGASAQPMVQLLQWINSNTAATKLVTSVLTSTTLPGIVTAPGKLLVGFGVWTFKVLALFLVAIAAFFMVKQGIEVSGPMREKMAAALMKFDVSTLWSWVRTVVLKIINSATVMVKKVKDKGVVRSLKRELKTLYSRAKEMIARRDVNYIQGDYGVSKGLEEHSPLRLDEQLDEQLNS